MLEISARNIAWRENRARRFVLVPLLFLLIGGAPCYGVGGVLVSTSALKAYPGATKIESREGKDFAQLTYHVNADFPASDLIRWISNGLEGTHWKPLEYDYLNPELPASRVRNWDGGFLKSLKQPGICVHLWFGYWQDAAGDIVGYTLRYEHPGCGTSALRDLEVVGTYMPADAAHRYQRFIQERKGATEVK